MDQYRDAIFPYYQKLNRKDKDAKIEALNSWIRQGPMSVTALWQKKARSKLKTKVVERSEQERVEATRRLSRRIGGFSD